MDKKSKQPVISLILGILSFFGFGLFTGIPAIIIGNNHRNKKRGYGDGLALWGIIIGSFSTFMNVMFLYQYFHPQIEAYLNDSPKVEYSQDSLPAQDIQVAVTYEETSGLTEQHLKDPDVLKAIEEITAEKMEERSKQAYYAQGGSGDFDVSFDSESWCMTIDGRNFAVVRAGYKNVIQSTSIMGIQNNAFVKISGFRMGEKIVPHSYGSCAEKAEEIFGVKFIKQ